MSDCYNFLWLSSSVYQGMHQLYTEDMHSILLCGCVTCPCAYVSTDFRENWFKMNTYLWCAWGFLPTQHILKDTEIKSLSLSCNAVAKITILASKNYHTNALGSYSFIHYYKRYANPPTSLNNAFYLHSIELQCTHMFWKLFLCLS